MCIKPSAQSKRRKLGIISKYLQNGGKLCWRQRNFSIPVFSKKSQGNHIIPIHYLIDNLFKILMMYNMCCSINWLTHRSLLKTLTCQMKFVRFNMATLGRIFDTVFSRVFALNDTISTKQVYILNPQVISFQTRYRSSKSIKAKLQKWTFCVV